MVKLVALPLRKFHVPVRRTRIAAWTACRLIIPLDEAVERTLSQVHAFQVCRRCLRSLGVDE